MDLLFQVEDVAEWLRGFGIWAVLVSVLLNVMIAVPGFIPTLFLSGANAVVFGMLPGFLVSLTGEVIGAGVSFWLYRWGFGKWKRMRIESWVWLKRLNEESHKRQMAILLLARLTPLVPSGVITFAAALSKMSFSGFIIVTLIGKAPSIALETLVGHDLMLINDNFPRLLISLLFSGLIFMLLKKRPKRE